MTRPKGYISKKWQAQIDQQIENKKIRDEAIHLIQTRHPELHHLIPFLKTLYE